jgi:hypothetical protein
MARILGTAAALNAAFQRWQGAFVTAVVAVYRTSVVHDQTPGFGCGGTWLGLTEGEPDPAAQWVHNDATVGREDSDGTRVSRVGISSKA